MASIIGAVCLATVLTIVITARGGDRSLYPPRPGEAVTIYLIDNDFHTDLAAPRALISGGNDPLSLAIRRTTRRPWVTLGWGDANFYTASGFTAARALDGLRSLFAAGNPSVVRIEGLRDRPDRIYRDGVRQILVSRARIAAMARRVDSALAVDADGAPLGADLAVETGRPLSRRRTFQHPASLQSLDRAAAQRRRPARDAGHRHPAGRPETGPADPRVASLVLRRSDYDSLSEGEG